MKVISLLPVKNEAWILRSTLKNMSDFSDHIVVADQDSNDGSLEIYKEFEKVIVIKNNNSNHNNSVRWQLLDFAREKFGISNLNICIDADEMIQPEAVEYIKSLTTKTEKSISFAFPWIQLWGNQIQHRVDAVWKKNYKGIIFYDDGFVQYERKTVLNDHTGRIPHCVTEVTVDQFPLLHYQYVHLDQAAVKQAWYRCSELVQGNTPRKINQKYSVALHNNNVVVEPINPDWVKNLPVVSIQYDIKSDWRYVQICQWFKEKGILFFEPLEIWHIRELRDTFIKEIKREPKVRKYPEWLVKLNEIKNKLNRK